MCHSIHGPPILPVDQENATSTTSAQWNSCVGRSHAISRAGSRSAVIELTASRSPAALHPIVVMAGGAGGVDLADRLLQGGGIAAAGDLRKLGRFLRHALHLRVEIGAIGPDLGLRARLALVAALAEEALGHEREL